MYSFPNLESVRCSMSGTNYWILAHIQVAQETSKVVWYSHLFKNFPQFVVIHTVKVLRLVSEAEVDIFLEFPGFLYDVMNVSNLILGSSAFSKFSLYIWKFSIHLPLKPILKDMGHNLTSMWSECIGSLNILWHCASLGFEWKNWPFPVLWPLLSFPNLLTYWMQHINNTIF